MKYLYDLLHSGRSREFRPCFQQRRDALCALVASPVGLPVDGAPLPVKVEFGPRLVYALVHAAVTTLPSYTLHDVGDVLYELMSYDRPEFCRWLEATALALPEHAPQLAVPLTRKQLVAFHAELTKAENSRDVADALRSFARLWR